MSLALCSRLILSRPASAMTRVPRRIQAMVKMPRPLDSVSLTSIKCRESIFA